MQKNMKLDTTKQAIDLLSDGKIIHDPVKFLEENKDNTEFLWFLSILLSKIVETEEKAREKMKKKIGEEMEYVYEDLYGMAYYSVDKGKLDNALNHEGNFNEMLTGLRQALKGIKIEE